MLCFLCLFDISMFGLTAWNDPLSGDFKQTSNGLIWGHLICKKKTHFNIQLFQIQCCSVCFVSLTTLCLAECSKIGLYFYFSPTRALKQHILSTKFYLTFLGRFTVMSNYLVKTSIIPLRFKNNEKSSALCTTGPIDMKLLDKDHKLIVNPHTEFSQQWWIIHGL